MTAWLPALCIGIVVLFTLWLATDRAISHGNDRLLGATIGFVVGLIVAGLVFALVRVGAWMMGGMA